MIRFVQYPLIAAALMASAVVYAQDPAPAPAADAAAAAAVDPALASDEGRFSYAVGVQVGQAMKKAGVALDAKAFELAIADILAGSEPRLNEQQLQETFQNFTQKIRESETKVRAEQGAANVAKGKEYLAATEQKEGVMKTASGILYEVLNPGTEGGAKPTAESTVKVHYTGTLIDGTKFDSSVDRGQPAEFPLNGVIKGWTEGLQLMPVGAKYRFHIPSELAYGEAGRPSIPPNSVLVFEVELLEIVK